MFCQSCGANINDGANFCESCGAKPDAPTQPVCDPNLVGFSQRINAPVFRELEKTSIRKNLIIGLIVSLALFLFFQVFPFFMKDFTRPIALIVGCLVGGGVLIHTLTSSAKRASAKPLDGEVANKKITEHNKLRASTTYSHTITFNLVGGGRKKIKKTLLTGQLDAWDMMIYLNIGDRVRYHGRLDYFEKYDKSRDTEIPCAGCRKYVDIRPDNCPNCRAPIIKP